MIYVLLVAHFVADFLCQSDWMALNKSKRWDALALHVGAYIAAMVIAMAAMLSLTDYRPPIAGSSVLFFAVNAAAHFVQDAITSRINSRLWFFELQPGVWTRVEPMAGPGEVSASTGVWLARGGNRHWFFVGIGFDQLLHYITLFVTAGWWLK